MGKTSLIANRADRHLRASSQNRHPNDTLEAIAVESRLNGNYIKKIARNHGSHVLGFIAAALFVAAFLPAFHMLWHAWVSSEDYTHAPIMIPIIAYMLWKSRAKLAENSGKFSLLSLLFVILTTIIYLFSILTQVQTFIFLSTYLVLVGSIIFISGAAIVKNLFTPLLLLLLLIPIPQHLYTELTAPLQLFVSKNSESLLLLFDVPLFREGNVMHLPNKSFEVAEACSGLRSVIILLSLSTVMGYFFLRRFPSKLVLFISSIPTAFVVNTIRVTLMIFLFHFFNIDLSDGTAHTLTGIVLLCIAVLILFILQKSMKQWETN